MPSYRIPLQENGRMILPAELRRALGVGKGDRVVVRSDGDRIEITTAARSRARARARLQDLYAARSGVVDELIAERRAEARREGDDDGAADGAGL
nr:AbrB/MazE/SpoVT family DNA-binding domain-containing protein [uncultured Jannaschia sp.]